MPIRQYFGTHTSFAPDDLQAMNEAFSSALKKLDVSDPRDAMVEV